MSSFKVVLSQACKGQVKTNGYWLSAWNQAVVLAGSEHRNLAPLNMLLEAVHRMPGMVVMPLVAAIETIGGKTKDSPGMIVVEISKGEKGTVLKAKSRKWTGDDKEIMKDIPLVSEDMVAKSKSFGWWDIAPAEKVVPPTKFSSLIAAVKKLSGDGNVDMTDQEQKLLGRITNLIVAELGGAALENKR